MRSGTLSSREGTQRENRHRSSFGGATGPNSGIGAPGVQSIVAKVGVTGLALFVGCLLSIMPLLSQEPGSLFESANKLYEQGKFSEAAATYEKLIQSGQTSAAIFFNLGNAYFKAGQIGRAVLAYRQAERINPRDPDVRANLLFARKQVQGPTFVATRWMQWLNHLTTNEWTLLLTAGLWALILLLILLQWRPAWRGSLRIYIVLLVLGVAFTAVCLIAVLNQKRRVPIAVVVTRDASVHHGPLEESQMSFVAHDGAELRVLDQKDNWLEVTAGGGRRGWLRRDQVALAPAT